MEFSFDVNMSNFPCGLNGAVYFSQMDADGGMARFPGNKAGAKYGTGYYDSQCPQDIKFIDGAVSIHETDSEPNLTHACPLRQTSLTGLLMPTMLTLAPALTALAALRWISGKLTLR